MIKNYQQLGASLSRSEMKEIKGGTATLARLKYECLIQDIPGWWVLCSSQDPTTNGCATYCNWIGVCAAGPNECV